MSRLYASFVLLLLFATSPAHAVVQGNASALGGFAIRVIGKLRCSGVAISRTAVATAAHCGRDLHVIAGGRSLRVAAISRSATLEDGRRVNVSGDAVVLQLASPLPEGVAIAPIGDGTGNSYTVAGYGTTNERRPSAFGVLHQANLIAENAYTLVDPNRTGSVGASACFGDSGGPVLRGGMLVGVITRAAHPSPRLSCGDLTRWAPLTAYDPVLMGEPGDTDDASVNVTSDEQAGKPARPKRPHLGTAGSFSLLGAFLPARR